MTRIPFRSATAYKFIASPSNQSLEITLERVKVASDLAGITLSGLTVALAVSDADGVTHFESQSVESHGDPIPFREYKSIELAATHIKTVFDGLGQNKNEEKYKPLKVISEAANPTFALISEARRQMTEPANTTYERLKIIESQLTSGSAVNSEEVKALYNTLKAHLFEIQLRDQSVTGLKNATDEPFTDAKVGERGRAREVFNHNQHAATQLLGASGISGKSQHELYFEGNMKWLERHFSDLRLGQDDAVSVSEVRSPSGSFVDDYGRSTTLQRTLQSAPVLTVGPLPEKYAGPRAPGSARQTSRLVKPPKRRKSLQGTDHAGPKPMLNSGTNRTAPRNTSTRFSEAGNSHLISTSPQEQHAESPFIDFWSQTSSFATLDSDDEVGDPTVGRFNSPSSPQLLPTITAPEHFQLTPANGDCVTFFQNPLLQGNSSFRRNPSRYEHLGSVPSSLFSSVIHGASYSTPEGRAALKQGVAVNRPFLPRDPDSIDAIDRFDDPISM